MFACWVQFSTPELNPWSSFVVVVRLTGSHCEVMASPELPLETRIVSSLQRFSCLCLLGTGINRGVHLHAQPGFNFYINF